MKGKPISDIKKIINVINTHWNLNGVIVKGKVSLEMIVLR